MGVEMTSFVLIEGFQYIELSDKARGKVLIWLDEVPLEYEAENEEGQIVTEYEYFSELDDVDVQEHCLINEYLFNRDGRPIHQYVLTEHRLNKEKQNE